MNRIKPNERSWLSGTVKTQALFNNAPHKRGMIVSIFDERTPRGFNTRAAEIQLTILKGKGF